MTLIRPFVYILTLNWNNADATTAFLHSCTVLTSLNYKLVVIDNASKAGSLDEMMVQFPQAEWIINDSNKGFAAGMNVGIEYAYQQGADFVFLANNDTLLAPDSLAQLLTAVIQYQADLASPTIYYQDPADRIWSIGGWRSPFTLEIIQAYQRLDPANWQEPFEVDFITGCGMLLSRACVQKVGLFDGRFFMYYEDSDYCLRARAAGCQIIVVPQAKMWHHVANSIGGVYSPGERYHMARASVQFFKKHVRGWRWLIVAPYRCFSAIKTILRLVTAGNSTAARAYLRGLSDGWRL